MMTTGLIDVATTVPAGWIQAAGVRCAGGVRPGLQGCEGKPAHTVSYSMVADSILVPEPDLST